MSYGNLSDLGQSFMLRRQGAELRASLTQLTTELTTGLKEDVGNHVRGDYGPLAGIEYSLQKIDGFASGRTGLELQVTGLQSSLGVMQSLVGEMGTKLLSATNLEQSSNMLATGAEASAAITQLTSYLNTQVAGEFLFSGVASEQKPLMNGEDILDQVRGIATASTDVSDFLSQVGTWFDSAGGGFDTLAYSGSSNARSDIPISEYQVVDLPVKADDEGFRTALKSLAVTAIVSEGSIPGTDEEKRSTIEAAAQSLLSSEQSLIGMQREIGETESLIERAGVAANAERAMMETARLDIIAADPYDTASALEAVQFQIESLYILTARTSQLRLSDYL